MAGFFGRIGFELNRKTLIFFGAMYVAGSLMLMPLLVQDDWLDDTAVVLRVVAGLFYGLPFIIVALGVCAYGLNTAFAAMFRRLPFPAFFSLCLALWLSFTYGCILAAMRFSQAFQDNILIMVLPIALMLIICCWASIQITWHYWVKGESVRYLLLHIPLVTAVLTIPYVAHLFFQVNIVEGVLSAVFEQGGKWEGYVFFLYAQIAFYCVYPLIGFVFTSPLRKKLYRNRN